MEIKVQVLEVLWTDGSGPGHHEVRIVRWNNGPAILEKRQFFMDRESGGVKPGKSKGLNLQDVERICENRERVCRLLQ